MPSLKILTFFSYHTVYSLILALNHLLADLVAQLVRNYVYVYVVNTHNEILVKNETMSKMLCFFTENLTYSPEVRGRKSFPCVLWSSELGGAHARSSVSHEGHHEI